jgi:Haem-binding domain
MRGDTDGRACEGGNDPGVVAALRLTFREPASSRRESGTPPPLEPGPPVRDREPHRYRRWAFRALLIGLAAFALAQAVPYGRSHSNPPTLAEPQWNTPATRALAVRACFDCHSNLTTWPWYSNVAPISWLVQRDVDGGRAALNFSEWTLPQDGAGDVSEAISGGSMPPWFYVLIHPKASLSKADQQALIAGLAATFRNSPPKGGG